MEKKEEQMILIRLKLKTILCFGFLWIPISLYSQESKPIQISYNQKTYSLYPKTLDSLPEIPSPYLTKKGIEVIVAFTKEKEYTLIPITVENGEPLNYNKGQWGKGEQLKTNIEDFPALSETGLHSETELNRTKSITGRAIAEITKIARPGMSSGAGFIAEDEDIISVLKGDNRLVNKLGLTHPELAKPLFNVFNLILKNREYFVSKIRPVFDIDYILYKGRKIYLGYRGAKGWQTSLFNDEVLGYYEIDIRRELNEDEEVFLKGQYSYLKTEQMTELLNMLSHIHTGEMVPYYIMRYGFYEGHTGYRADPVAIAFMFGLKSIEEIEKSFPGRIYDVLTGHFTR